MKCLGNIINSRIRSKHINAIVDEWIKTDDFFYKTVEGGLDVWLEIEPFDALAELEFSIFTNEGYVIEAGHKFLEYGVGALSKIVPYQWNRPDRGLWTDENR